MSTVMLAGVAGGTGSCGTSADTMAILTPDRIKCQELQAEPGELLNPALASATHAEALRTRATREHDLDQSHRALHQVLKLRRAQHLDRIHVLCGTRLDHTERDERRRVELEPGGRESRADLGTFLGEGEFGTCQRVRDGNFALLTGARERSRLV